MKREKVIRKLELSKETVANLELEQLHTIRGGRPTLGLDGDTCARICPSETPCAGSLVCYNNTLFC